MVPILYTMWLLLAVLVLGALATYLYDDEMPPSARLASGVPVGVAGFGLVAFGLAHVTGGLDRGTLLLAWVACAVPLAAALRGQWGRIGSDVRRLRCPPRRRRLRGLWLYYLTVTFLLWRFFARTIWETPGGVYTAVIDNFADLAYHVGFVESFAQGDNFPPTHPMYAGYRLSYPFLADFFSACLLRAGMSRANAFFWPNLALGLSLVGLLHRLTLQWTRSPVAGYLAPPLLLLGGGLGFVLLLPEARESGTGLAPFLRALPHYCTEWEKTLYWGNPLVYWFAPMRGMLLAAPLLLAVWSLLFQAVREGATGRKHVAAAVLTGLLPLAHAHSFVSAFALGVAVLLLWGRWRHAGRFALVALAAAAPQFAVLLTGSATQAGTFLALSPGWMGAETDERNLLVFWLMNAGLFLPVLLLALVWRRRGRWLVPPHARRFYLPFLLCFLLPNAVKFAPWEWDSIKVLYVWFLASVPLVALFLARLWRSRTPGGPAVGMTLFVLLTLSGALDVGRVLGGQDAMEVFTAEDAAVARQISRATPPDAVVLCAPLHNSPVMLSGRRMFLTYAGFLWTNGLPYEEREREVESVFRGGPGALDLLRRRGVGYVLLTDREREWANERGLLLNDAFFACFPRADDGTVPGLRLYRVP